MYPTEKKMTKTLLLTLSVCFIFNAAFAGNFDDSWIKAVEYCSLKKFDQAEMEFNNAINDLEIRNDNSHMHAYVDRARLFMLLERYDEALVDLNKALLSDKLIGKEKVRALLSRMATYANLQMEAEAMSDFAEFKRIDPNFPKSEYMEDRIIIKNAPNSELYKRLITSYFVNSQICENESDIQELPSGIISIKKNHVIQAHR